MLINIAIGDAYGAAFEFASKYFVRVNNHLKYVTHHRQLIPTGRYTDDTQMSIAIVNMMLSDKDWTPLNIAGEFLECYTRDRRAGYAGGFQMCLDTSHSAAELIGILRPTSHKNGAAMRSVPLGYIPDICELLNKARVQASVTHNTVSGIQSSQAVALMSHYFIYKRGLKAGLAMFVRNMMGVAYLTDKTSPTDCDAKDTVDAVLTVLTKSNSMTEVLHNSIGLGGDTDSVASIALGIASLSEEYENDLPKELLLELEYGNYRYGVGFLNELNHELAEKYKCV